MLFHLLPLAHTQGVKQSVLSVIVVIVVTKIARSRILRICACCNYHGLVDIGEKLVSVCFELLNIAPQIVHFLFSMPVVYQPHSMC